MGTERNRKKWAGSDEKHAASLQRRELRRTKKETSRAIKRLGGKCRICGSAEGLKLDYINKADRKNKTDGKTPLGKALAIKGDNLSKEIAKSQVLCATCHETETANDAAP